MRVVRGSASAMGPSRGFLLGLSCAPHATRAASKMNDLIVIMKRYGEYSPESSARDDFSCTEEHRCESAADLWRGRAAGAFCYYQIQAAFLPRGPPGEKEKGRERDDGYEMNLSASKRERVSRRVTLRARKNTKSRRNSRDQRGAEEILRLNGSFLKDVILFPRNSE